MKRKRNKYKVETSSSMMTEAEMNQFYAEGWELIQVVSISNNSFTHVFKHKTRWAF